ncbi:MAG TPA: metallophosphoesterase [Chitinophagaceae bacterium]|nr:metallophosphoesterase [Chitinophagaceae bacterium]
MRNSRFWWVLIVFMFLLDLYFFLALETVSHNASASTRLVIYAGYWTLSATALISMFMLPYLGSGKQARLLRTTLFAIVAGLFFAKILAAVFFLLDDARRGIQWLIGLFSTPGYDHARSVFMSWAGIGAGTGLFSFLVWGFGNKYRYQVKRHKLIYPHLPANFKGLRIVHISDIHAGSLKNKKAVMKGVQKILDEKPDIVLFTGDLVNNVSDEMDEYVDIFEKVKAPLGVFATLGNHDYGDYVHWNSVEEKKQNLEKLKAIHHAMGWRLLMNESIILEKENDRIVLMGIENWSRLARFPKYGDLSKAYAGSETATFRILMSHDPSHWKAEVCTKYPGIDLMLSGHTHGMQFGFEILGFRWSPVQFFYKEWAGLYESGDQKLYVNRGFGFLGYPGRVGILPEITVLELV